MAGSGSKLVGFFLGLIFLLIATTSVLIYRQVRTDAVAEAMQDGSVIRTLIVAGEDGNVSLSIVLFVHPETRRVAVLDVPAEVGGIVESLGRVDAYAQTFAPQDSQQYHEIIEDLIGVPIAFRIAFSREALVDFVDLIGGLDMFIVNDAIDLRIPSGSVLLDGPKAVRYLAFRDPDEAGLDRAARRQSFVESFLRVVAANADFLNHADVVDTREQIVSTQLDRRSLSALFSLLGEAGIERAVTRRVQGTVRNVDVEGERLELLFPHFEGQWIKQSVAQIESTLASDEVEQSDAAVVTIEVLNGTATDGLARRTSQLYEDFGFVVQRFGNASTSQVEHTVVIDRRGFGAAAERVAQIIEAGRIVTETDNVGDVDVTVILGRDFDGSVVRTGN